MSETAQETLGPFLVDGRIAAIRINRTLSAAGRENNVASGVRVSYDIAIRDSQMMTDVHDLIPANRTGRNVNINSAAVGTPCKVEFRDGGATLYLHEEELPFGPCPPVGTGP